MAGWLEDCGYGKRVSHMAEGGGTGEMLLVKNGVSCLLRCGVWEIREEGLGRMGCRTGEIIGKWKE